MKQSIIEEAPESMEDQSPLLTVEDSDGTFIKASLLSKSDTTRNVKTTDEPDSTKLEIADSSQEALLNRLSITAKFMEDDREEIQ